MREAGLTEKGRASRLWGLEMEGEACRFIEASARGQGIAIRLLERGYRARGGEVDLIFEERAAARITLVFVEVRARRGAGLARAEEFVDGRKRRRLLRAVQEYLARYQGPATEVRADLWAWDHGQWVRVPDLLVGS